MDQYPYYVEREWWKDGYRMTFWPSWRAKRSVKYRLAVKQHSEQRLRYKALKENTILPQAIRDEAAEMLKKLPRNSSPKLVVNECLVTGQRRGKLKRFRVKRHEFRRYADSGKLCGIQRAIF